MQRDFSCHLYMSVLQFDSIFMFLLSIVFLRLVLDYLENVSNLPPSFLRSLTMTWMWMNLGFQFHCWFMCTCWWYEKYCCKSCDYSSIVSILMLCIQCCLLSGQVELNWVWKFVNCLLVQGMLSLFIASVYNHVCVD